MLVLTRKKDESIIIGEEIEVIVLEITPTQIRLGIEAPTEYPVYRKEVFLEIKAANQKAGQSIFTKNFEHELAQFFQEIKK